MQFTPAVCHFTADFTNKYGAEEERSIMVINITIMQLKLMLFSADLMDA